jgi:hypothetical protein
MAVNAQTAQEHDIEAFRNEKNSWQNYAPPTAEFTVLMPTPVTVKDADALGVKFRTYSAQRQGIQYFVMGGMWLPGGKPALKGYTAGVERRLLKDGADLTSENQPAEGKGWIGTSLSIKSSGTPSSAALVCFSPVASVVYILEITAPIDSQQAKLFLRSFEINEQKAAKLYDNPPSQILDSAIKKYAPTLMLAIGAFASLLFIALICTVVLVIRRNDRNLGK